MNVLVVSDTHGRIEPVVRYMLQNERLFEKVFHLGDHYKDALAIASATGREVIGIKGNCDPYADVSEDKIIEIEGKKIMITHGHLYGVKYSLLRLHLHALESGLDMICFGHTHVATQAFEDGVMLFNPGSASEPRRGGYPSVGLVSISQKGIFTTLVPLLQTQSSD